MSYRAFKRLLGETSLERKCHLLFGTCSLLLITASFFWYARQTEELVYEQSKTTGRLGIPSALAWLHLKHVRNEPGPGKPKVEPPVGPPERSRWDVLWEALAPEAAARHLPE